MIDRGARVQVDARKAIWNEAEGAQWEIEIAHASGIRPRLHIRKSFRDLSFYRVEHHRDRLGLLAATCLTRVRVALYFLHSICELLHKLREHTALVC
jgi:hypothetical protein